MLCNSWHPALTDRYLKSERVKCHSCRRGSSREEKTSFSSRASWLLSGYYGNKGNATSLTFSIMHCGRKQRKHSYYSFSSSTQKPKQSDIREFRNASKKLPETRIRYFKQTLTYLQLMQTVVKTFKHHFVKQLQHSDTGKVLYCPHFILKGRNSPGA